MDSHSKHQQQEKEQEIVEEMSVGENNIHTSDQLWHVEGTTILHIDFTIKRDPVYMIFLFFFCFSFSLVFSFDRTISYLSD
jgi:hypothetical protein